MTHRRIVGVLLAIGLAVGFAGTAMAATKGPLTENVASIGDVEKQNPDCVLGLVMLTPAEGDIDRSTEDVYCSVVLPGTNIHFRVDTIAAGTAGDLHACLSTSPDRADAFACGDDNFACTFPPPAFSCPEGTVPVPAGVLEVYTIIGTWDSWSPSSVEYELTLEMDGLPLGANLVEDNRPQQGP